MPFTLRMVTEAHGEAHCEFGIGKLQRFNADCGAAWSPDEG
jgi:hypothetical protein